MVSVQYTASSGNATPGVDFLPASGAVTLTPGAPTQTVNVSVIGDLTPEYHESVRMEMQNPQGAVLTSAVADGLIQDDDVRGEVDHGAVVSADLASGPVGPFPPADTYRFRSRGPSSWEFVVDGASGDVAPIVLERLDFYSFSVFQSVQGTASSVSLRSEFPDVTFSDYDHAIRVRSGGCSTDCDAADLYRLRAYETTGRIARFNNSTSQTTLVILQNPSSETVTAHLVLWSVHGSPLVESPTYTLSPRASVVVSTASLAPDQSGSITVTHDAPYGVLQGKAVALEPSTGFSFDSPLVYRPR